MACRAHGRPRDGRPDELLRLRRQDVEPRARHDRRPGGDVRRDDVVPLALAHRLESIEVVHPLLHGGEAGAVHGPDAPKRRAHPSRKRTRQVGDAPAVGAPNPTPQIHLRRRDLATGPAQSGERVQPLNPVPQTLDQPRAKADNRLLIQYPGREAAKDGGHGRAGRCAHRASSHPSKKKTRLPRLFAKMRPKACAPELGWRGVGLCRRQRADWAGRLP